MTEPSPHQMLYLVHQGGDTFSVENAQGEVSLVDGATLKQLLNQLSKGHINGPEVEGEALG